MIPTRRRRAFNRSGRWGTACTVAVLGMAVLAACAPRSEYWSPSESPKQNVVRWAEFHHPVRFTTASAEPAKAERDALTQFLARVGQGQGVRISLASAAVDDSRLGLRRETALADFLRSQGFQVTLGPASSGASVNSGSVQVTVGRYLAKAPTCPDWSKPATGDRTNRVTSNFGCATATNLGLMVADPGVLVRGTDIGPADAEAVAPGVKSYREGKEKAAKPITTLSITGGSGG